MHRFLHQIQRATVSSWEAVAGLVYPEVCVFCTSDLCQAAARSPGVRLCRDCEAKFADEGAAVCFACGAAVGPNLPAQSECLECRTRDFRFQQVIRLGLYEDELRTAVIRGKSPGALPLSAALGELLYGMQAERLRDANVDLVTFVPQHWGKRLVQHHHQAETVAEILSKRLRLPLARWLLVKKRHTRDQSDLPRSERLKNLTAAFGVRRWPRVRGRNVLLVDDILTTGSTANECTKVLRAAGAKAVAVAVIARVP